MRVLVTGAAGLLGRAVVPLLRERGHEVWELDSRFGARKKDTPSWFQLPFSASEWIGMGQALGISSADAVIHLAGRRASVAKQHALAADLLLDNLAIDVNVFRAMRAHGVKRGVYASTVSVYPPAAEIARMDGALSPEDHSFGDFAFTESDAVGFPDDSVRFSAWGKLTAERMIEAMNLQDGSAISVVRLVNTYGPHDNFGDDALVIPSLIKRIAGGENPLHLIGADNERDFLYVDDAARGIVAALEHPMAGTWNLGTGIGVRIHDVAATVGQAFAVMLGIDDEDGLHGLKGATRKVVDPSKALRDLQWKPTVSLSDGIRRTIEWWRSEATNPSSSLERREP